MASVFCTAIDEILIQPRRPLSEVDLFTQRDLSQIQRWNLAYPEKVNACVHDLVLQHAKGSPQSPALSSWDGALTYQQLEGASSLLARHFGSVGIKQGDLVPICFRKSIYAVIAMVAILRAGAAFVPLDPSHPEDRLKAIILKANATIVATSTETAHLFHELGVTIIEVSSVMLKSQDPSPDHPIPDVSPETPAFVLFTSGSTGTPKGIVQEHASVSTSSLAHGRMMRINSDSRVFQYAAFTFDVSMMDIFTTLIYGGCVCIPSEQDRMGTFTSVMNDMQINWVLFTPSVASLITPEEVPTLQTLVFGGEAVKQENISRWFGKVRLFNCYGPAECGACAIGEVAQEDSRPGNIGRQFGAELCWVVDPENHHRLLPIGAIGELVVEGPTLARGYLDDLAKTQAVFFKSPSWPHGAGPDRPRRLYKTGDLVRQNSDGSFDFAGRKDLQLKVRGQRVELGEVEYHLSTFSGVALCMAAMPQSGCYAGSLIGVIQPQRQHGGTHAQSTKIELISNEQALVAKLDKEKVTQFMKSKLPNYMVPGHLLIVDTLPLSVSGKIDRKVVNAWLVTLNRTFEPNAMNNGHRGNLLPKDNVTALEVCSKIVSMVSQPGSAFFESLIDSDFSLAAVALDSIQVINLTMFIRKRFGVKVYLDTLMDPGSTVRSIADSIEKLAGGLNITAEPKIDIMETFRRYKQNALKNFPQTEAGCQNLFVTGATGFLGSRILYQLCGQTNVRNVVVLVRGRSAEHALQRIVKTAELAGWWSDECCKKLEAWVGDLAKPQLDLSADQWRRLCGSGPPAERITAVIHNGAAVNWNASFLSLKATNVDSTVELLKAASQSAALSDFVFVSGGQELRIGEDDDADIAEEVARSNGYAQTKFLSELMVKEYAREFAPRQQQVSIVKPGYIIGTVREGVAVTDDFIWRLTASCIEIKGYNASDADSWLFISDVDNVAAAVLRCCRPISEAAQSRSANVVKVLDGMPMSDFWSTLKHECGYELYPLGSESWLDRTYTAIEVKGEKHPLFPLFQTIEEGQGRLGSPCDPRGSVDIDEQRVKAAVKKSVEYLSSIGFFPEPRGGTTLSTAKTGVRLTRSPLVVVA